MYHHCYLSAGLQQAYIFGGNKMSTIWCCSYQPKMILKFSKREIARLSLPRLRTCVSVTMRPFGYFTCPHLALGATDEWEPWINFPKPIDKFGHYLCKQCGLGMCWSRLSKSANLQLKIVFCTFFNSEFVYDTGGVYLTEKFMLCIL